ncbi:EAL domain-containing protein [Selenomonas sp. AB3002]|uniref:EAL domain-containing protein n=1 Tax=Selenomonas sp. AB3002 TaxID=1392502 RepID=UPI000497125C
MGRNLRAVFALLLAFFLCLIPKAEATENLRVGYVPGTGFLEEDSPGHLIGSGFEYMEFLAGFGNWNMVYIPCVNWWEAVDKLSKNEIDILPGMPGDYSTVPFAKRTDHVVARFPMELVLHENLASRHLRIGVLDYGYPIPNLPAVALENAFTYELVTFHDYADLKIHYTARQLDGYVAPMLRTPDEGRVVALFDRVSYRLLIRTDRPDLYNKVNDAMDQLLMNQPNIRNRLRDKYDRSQGLPLVLEPDERAFLQQKKHFRAAVYMPHKPFLYKDEESGEWQGVTAVLLEQLEKDLDIEIEIVEGDSLENLKRLVARGTVDFVADVPCDFSWLKELGLSPTQSFRTIDYTPIIRKGFPLPQNPKVAVIEEIFPTQISVKENYSPNQIIYCHSMEECFRAVSNGRADVTYAPRSVVPYLMEGSFTYNLEALTESFYRENISLGVSTQADPRLWRILDKEITHLPPNFTQNVVLQEGTEIAYSFSPRWMIYHYPLLTTVGLFVIMGLIIGVMYYRYYMRRRHMMAIQQMAYMDNRYQLPNMLWLEQEIKGIWEEATRQEPDSHIYVAVFDLSSRDSMLELYSRHSLDKRLRETAMHLQEEDWVLQTAAGINTLQLVAVCQAATMEEMVSNAAEAVNHYGYIEHDSARISLHIKVGLCEMKSDTMLLMSEEKADMACRKIMGTMDIVKLYDEKMDKYLHLEQHIESSMGQALADGEFAVWYQAQYDIMTRRIVGAESLIRWQSKEMGFLSPEKFMPSLEMNGFIIPLDHFVLKQVMMVQKHRLTNGQELLPISVNQSRLHITEDGYLRRMKDLIEKYQLPPGTIQLEIPESMFANFNQKSYRDHAVFLMDSLHKAGYGIILDNFGGGAASLTLLDYLPLDGIKISASILYAAQNSDGMKEVLSSMIVLGQKLGLNVMVGGIETVEQEQMLLSMGCHTGQGFLNSRPVPKAKFIELLKERNGE